ncbi:troponin C, isotype gamma-like [Haliotis rubra]|uniref:troponin C, isotype gamma-like n=1 Tax=Haliotis rubra TaxID=36100 RepID=UPI001EE4FCDF|nr:troponin C, isotype gamma-like [Haliotis rubra]
MATLSRQEVKLYTEFFQQVDETDGDGNGRLSLENCEKLLDKCGHRIPRDVIQTFVNPGGDGSWTLTLEEFLAAMSEVVPPDSPHSKAAELRRLFRAYDLNKDGYVSFYELKNTMRGSVTEDELRDFIKDWDKDGDWKLSFEEFINMYVAPMPSDNNDDVTASAESKPSNM